MLVIGQKASYNKTITEEDINAFAIISGDRNPVHMDDVEAKKYGFEGKIAHGLLPAALISTVLGTIMPGNGTIYLGQNLNFIRPVYVGDTITAEVSVSEIMKPEKGIYRLKTICVNQDGECVVDGEAVIKFIGE